MAFEYDLTRIDDWQRRCYDDDGRLKPETENVIWTLFSIGVNEITTKTVGEIAFRWMFLEALRGTKASTEREQENERIISMLHDHMGLHTNATPQSRAKWLKAHMSDFETDVVEYHLRKRSIAA